MVFTRTLPNIGHNGMETFNGRFLRQCVLNFPRVFFYFYEEKRTKCFLCKVKLILSNL